MPVKKPAAGPVPKEALDFFKEKKIKPAFSYLEVWKEEHNYAFTVAKIMEKDILEDVRASLEESLAGGVPFAEWKKTIKPTLDKSGWSAYGTEQQEASRLKKIYKTNMRVARATGQWQRAERTKRALPYLMYVLGPSERHRPVHASWAGMILRIDDPFWQFGFPPNGWGCNCGTIQMSAKDAAANGGVDDSPEVEYEDWDNPETGVTEQIPKGIDPGWDYNPGKERAQKLKEAEDA
jgi:uncharacterized protein with gpF-like domain